ncbi:hypothetical protein ACWCOT_42400 [Nonomuraea bangladeshensis]
MPDPGPSRATEERSLILAVVEALLQREPLSLSQADISAEPGIPGTS